MKHGITNKGPAAKGPSSTAITTAPPPAKVVDDSRGPGDDGRRRSVREMPHPLWQALEIVASLRITVVLFVLSIILVFYGTWAQVDQGIWTAVETYFRSWFVLIPVRVLSCRLIDSNVGVPFPGGWLLGSMLMCNLLAAHAVRFKVSWKRSGILLIHAGLIIMMASEFFTGVYAVEGNMTIKENETVNFIEHAREPEIAVIEAKGREDHVVVVPASRLETGKFLSHEELPFDIQIVQYMKNSDRIQLDKATNQATKGFGLSFMVQEVPEISGTSTDQRHDAPSAYVNLLDKSTGQPMGTYLISYWLEPDTVTVNGKDYDIALRPKRSYRDFRLKLIEFKFDRHPGTQKPKNYQSDVILMDPEKKENRKVSISMNSPLRYGGETFYQASFTPDERGTVLQVVQNPVWTWPYIACIVVTLGMSIHFGINLINFLGRRMAI